jgi:hypothetical protein
MARSSIRGTITASLPVDWFAKESFTFWEPGGQVNVIVSSEPLDPEIDTETYATMQGDLLEKEFPLFEQLEFESVDIFGGRLGFQRIFEWTPPDGIPVTQMQLYHVVPGRGYTATATTPSNRFSDFKDVMLGILMSLKIESGMSTPGSIPENVL